MPKSARWITGRNIPDGLPVWAQIVHHAKKASSEKKADSIMAIPPLYHGIDGTWINIIGFKPGDGYFHAIDNMQ